MIGFQKGSICRYILVWETVAQAWTLQKYLYSFLILRIFFLQADPQARNVLTRRKKSSESEEEEEEEQKEEAEEEEEEEESDEENQGYTPLDYAGDDEEVIFYSLSQNRAVYCCIA